MVVHNVTIQEDIKVRDQVSVLLIEELTLQLFNATCGAIWKRRSLSAAERKLFESQANELDENLRDLHEMSDGQLRALLCRSVMLALSLGFLHVGSPEVALEVEREIQKKEHRCRK